jgi:hypothetical protein
VSEEYYAYASGLCIFGIVLSLFRAGAETLFFTKEMLLGAEYRKKKFFMGVLRDLEVVRVVFSEHTREIWVEGWLIWISSILFVVYFG